MKYHILLACQKYRRLKRKLGTDYLALFGYPRVGIVPRIDKLKVFIQNAPVKIDKVIVTVTELANDIFLVCRKYRRLWRARPIGVGVGHCFGIFGTCQPGPVD